MKKKEPRHHTERLPVVVLYEGDINELASILHTSESSTVSFEKGDTIYESLDELRELQGEVLYDFNLVVETHSDEIGYTHSSVNFKSDHVMLSCNSTHELSFRQATDFLKARRRWTAKVPDPLWEIMYFLFLPAAFFLMYAALVPAGYVSGPFRFVVFSFSVCIFLVSVLVWLAKIHSNLIFLKKRHEHAGFFRRNEAHIVKAGIGLIFGILGYVLRMLLE